MTDIRPLKEVQKEHALKVLHSVEYDLEKAARILGISIAALKRKLKDWDHPGYGQGSSGQRR